MKILITAGSTHEHIDPVRYITNASSGRQGILLAHEAVKRGHGVVLILGKTNVPDIQVERPGLEIINVTSADEMYTVAVKVFPSCDVAICAAAVGDYKVKNIATEKIKRNGDSVILELVPNKDIAKELGAMKTPNQTLIGFALETNNGYENAMNKLHKKNLDYVILNEITSENPAFNVDFNSVQIIGSVGGYISLGSMSKNYVAKRILDLCL